jgi:hypothetical protein
MACQAWTDIQDLDDLRYKHFKARLIKLATMKEEHRNMHEKPLLNMYQASSKPKQEREKRKWDEEKKLHHRSDNCGKRRELTHTPRSDREKKFQNNCKALVGVPQAEIDQYKVDKASCWCCGHSSYHMIECFAKKTSKGTKLATIVAAVSKKAKCQWPSEDSEYKDNEPTEPVSKWPKKVATVT